MTESQSYHGQPVTKPPTWTWEIPNYLFAGGLAGASAALAYTCELRDEPVLARNAWGVAFLAVSVSPPLLIMDLGRPARFLNMLRVIKVTSPMSIGSWILVVSGTSIGLAAARTWLGLWPPIGNLAAPVAAVFGLPLASYTAALLSATSVPVWHEARRTMPLVFVAGAGVSAGGAAVMVTPPKLAASARRLALGCAVAELVFTEVMERSLGEMRGAYEGGPARRFGWAARGCLTAGTGLLASRNSSRPAAAAAGALLLAGALSTRWSVFKAGFASVEDPSYAVGSQRRRIARGGDRGARRKQTEASGDPELGTPALPSHSPLRGYDPPRDVDG